MRLAWTATLVLAFGALAMPCVASPAPVRKAIFKDGASSTGWIDFDFQDGKRIFVPVKINGHDAMVQLATGLRVSDIDKSFAASVGLHPDSGSNSISGLRIQIGALTLENTTASAVDFAPLAKHIGHPLPFLLGDDAFNELAVDIDFAHHRIAFSDPASQAKPDGAVEVPLIPVEDLHLVPVSIEGAPPAQFELGLGNSGEILVYQPYYESHKLLDGRRLSKRLAAGTGGFVVEPVTVLNRAEFAGITFLNMPAALIPSSAAGTTSSLIAGDMGLPILTRFRLILDYSHERLYAAPYADAGRAPFAKDRLGLALTKEDAGFAVEFVAPGSPAEAAGFKAGDKVTLINGKPVEAWPEKMFADLKYGASGTNLAFTMQGGGVRQVKLADYF
ncbi:MAG: PDZ domain-containing protein [Terracidiphilus sp.]